MQFNTISEFLMMGGYAAYIWPAYGITLLILCAQLFAALKTRRSIIKKLKAAWEKNNASIA